MPPLSELLGWVVAGFSIALVAALGAAALLEGARGKVVSGFRLGPRRSLTKALPRRSLFTDAGGGR